MADLINYVEGGGKAIVSFHQAAVLVLCPRNNW
jgi:hypothetical protein